jgi:hypothetical protein
MWINLHRREDNIRVDHKEISWEGLDWIDLAYGWDKWWPLVEMELNLGFHFMRGIC